MAGFDMAWELDLWGKIRRGIEAADAHLESQVEGYDDALVMLQSEVAAAYIQLRTIEEQLRYTRKNVELQRASFDLIQKRFELGVVGELDVRQAGAELAITESLVPTVGTGPSSGSERYVSVVRHAPWQPAGGTGANRGRSPCRRPRWRSGFRPICSGAARTYVKRSVKRRLSPLGSGSPRPNFIRVLAITGTISFEAEQFGDLFRWESRGGRIGPGLQWNVLNYGRIRNRVRIEDARFQQAVLAYQNTVLAANKEAEDALVAYLREQQRLKLLEQATQEVRALEIGLRLYEQGIVDYQRVLDSQRATVLQQDTLAQSRGQVALNLVSVYKALGGGWTMHLEPGAYVEPRRSAVRTDTPPPSCQSPTNPEEL
jgi:outer membrane protein TolC